MPSPAENAATVREALRIGGMTGKQPHAALDALLAQAEAAEALRGDLIELPKSEGDARAGGNPDASSGIAPAPTRSGEARSGRTPQGRTPAQLADTVLRFGGPTWDERSRAALGALLAKAETAEENDEEIARLEGALDQAHKDYDETKAERDAAEEKNKKLSALIVEQERQYRDERDAAAREAEQERRDWQIRDRAMTDYFADAERRAEEAERAAEQAQEALRHINYEWELNDHVPSQHLAAIARAAGELPMGSQTIRALREAREALRHAAKIPATEGEGGDVRREHMMKPTRVMVDVGRRRSWRTLWLRREVVWEIVWMGTIKGFSTTTMGSTTLELAESVEFLRKKYSVS